MLRTAATYASINIHLSISNFLILGQNLIQTLIRQTPPIYTLQSSISLSLSLRTLSVDDVLNMRLSSSW